MNILDIFSWLPAKEMSIEEIENIVIELYRTKDEIDGFSIEMQLPDAANENVIGVKEDLINEGKKVCFLTRNGSVIAAIGYR